MGILTQALLFAGANHVVAIEKDYRCIDLLQPLVDRFVNRLIVLEADALDLDFLSLGPPPYRIVSNLPYNISTLLLVNWLRRGPFFKDFILMFQREVVNRLFAMPSSKYYTRLSVLVQFFCNGFLLIDILPKSFVPIPRVLSSVVKLTPNRSLFNFRKNTYEDLERITKVLFSQRRKMLRVSLRSLTPFPAEILFQAKILPTLRVENLTVNDFDLLITLINNFKIK